MLTILAILIIFIIVVLLKVLQYDCYPCGKSKGYQGAPSFEGRFDILNRYEREIAAWFRAMYGGLLKHELETTSLYFGSSIFG